MPSYNVSAVVLHRVVSGEADRILTLYTREQGKISAIAKGARKAGSRLSGATELFTVSRMQLAQDSPMPKPHSSDCRLFDTRSSRMRAVMVNGIDAELVFPKSASVEIGRAHV